MKYTMDDFIKNRIAVKVNPGNINLFLDMCEKSGLLWGDGKKATEHVPDHASYIFYDFPGKAKSLAYARNAIGEFALEIEKFKKIDFADIAHINRYQIIIDCDGDTTTAKMIVNGKEVKAAQAKRNPADKLNWKLAAELAFSRLWGEKKAEKPKPKVKKVKRNAKVGEYIQLISPLFSFNKKGDILLVSDIAPSGNPIANDWCYTKDFYVVLEGYKPSK